MLKKVILGLTEQVDLIGNQGQKINIKARIDTGATSSSIDLGLAKELNLGPVVKSKVVKSASGVKKRPIVKAKIILREIEMEEEFTIANRNHMTYQVLIGQNILKKGNFLIDPLKK
ncbi:MAG: RimK/LysX family protein [Nanoarchaeota archaeon]|nr:RimK/LysX family protein [Nanoarchaeota archaeon]